MYRLREKRLFGFVPLFMRNVLQKAWARTHPEPTFYDTEGNRVRICSSFDTHKWFYTRADKRPKCYWCRMYMDELFISQDQVVGEDVADMYSQNPQELPILPSVPQPDFDFNSPTSVTVNLPDLDSAIIDESPDLERVQKTDHAEAYCLRCKVKNVVLNPSYEDVQSRRGVRRYLKGNCAVCGSKINAIVKRGSD